MEGGGDGRSYFKVLEPYTLLLEVYEHAFEVRRRYAAIPNPAARAKAQLVGLMITQLADEVRAAQIAAAAAAENAITARIRATRKRPDRDSPLLINAIRAHAIQTRNFPTGAVGVGDLAALALASDRLGRPYWKAQEFGSDHLVGRTFRGFFQPGDVPASIHAFRQQSDFEVRRSGPPMTIKRPIEERAFLRKGAADADLFRNRLLSGAVTTASREADRILLIGSLTGSRRVGPRLIRE